MKIRRQYGTTIIGDWKEGCIAEPWGTPDIPVSICAQSLRNLTSFPEPVSLSLLTKNYWWENFYSQRLKFETEIKGTAR